MQDLQIVIYLIRDLKKDCLKKRHWSLIFNELNIHLNAEDFTLSDLMKNRVYSQHQSIRDIVKMAETEWDYESQLLLINTQIEETLRFKLIPYKEEIYVLSEFDIIQTQLEEFQVILKKGFKTSLITDVDTKERFKELLIKVDSLASTLEKLLDAQKMFLTLDAIFSQQALHKALPADTKKFLELKKAFKTHVSARLNENSSLKHFSQVHLAIQEHLDKISSKGTLIQKSLEDYLEAKRLAFPRFFFMTDK